MLPAASIDDFLGSPVGKFVAGDSYLAWCSSPTLAGTCYFANPRAEDLEALTKLSVLPRHTALHRPFDAIIDAGALEVVGTDAFATFSGHIGAVVADVPPVRRVGVVRPPGIVGAAIAGIYYDRGIEKVFDAALFSDPMEAFGWLERDDGVAVHDDVATIVAKVRGTPPMLRLLRDWLATHLDHPQLEDAARALRSSTRTLQRSLLACATSFRAEVERARVREAERRLTEGDEKIEVIARHVGCASPSHFAALFRRTTGEAPADFPRTPPPLIGAPGASRYPRPVKAYLDLLQRILDEGRDRDDRTGTGTRGVFGHHMRFDLRQGFPLLTTKKLHLRSIAHELLWFLRGETHVASLQKDGVKIWDEWATAEQTARFGRKEGDLGPIYGHQWRNFGATKKADGTYENDGVDQIRRVLEQLRTNPNSRRLIVTGWNPKEADEVALPPCHTLFQLYVQSGELSCQLYQRSGDVFLGVPFNIASYALLTQMVAHVSGLRPGDFVHTLGDAHLYKNHLDQAREQLKRTPRPLPRLVLNPAVSDLFAFRYEDITLEGYDPLPHIKAEVSV